MSESDTRLQQFMTENRIRPYEILELVTFSRPMLDALRKGTSDGSRLVMGQVRAACSQILKRDVALEEVFDFDVPLKQPEEIISETGADVGSAS